MSSAVCSCTCEVGHQEGSQLGIQHHLRRQKNYSRQVYQHDLHEIQEGRCVTSEWNIIVRSSKAKGIFKVYL